MWRVQKRERGESTKCRMEQCWGVCRREKGESPLSVGCSSDAACADERKGRVCFKLLSSGHVNVMLTVQWKDLKTILGAGAFHWFSFCSCLHSLMKHSFK